MASDNQAQMLPCRVCGEYLTPDGTTCERCLANLEDDRLRRETNGGTL